MIWSLAAALIAVRTSERTAVFLTVATGFLATWHVLTYAWVSGIVGAALAPDRPTGIARDWIERNLPGAEFLGQAISSLVIVAVGALVLAHLRPEGGLPRLRRTGALVALPISGLVFAVGMVGATLAGAASGLSVSGPEAALTKAGAIVQQTPFELKPVGNWTSEPLTESGTVDQAALRVHVNSQPGLEDLELRLEKGGRVLASAKEALWRLDPESEQGTVTLNFDRQAQVHGARLVIRRIALPGSRSPEGLDPIVYLEGVSGEVIAKDGTRRVVSTPSVDLRAGQLAAIGPRVRNALLSPTRLLGPPLAGLSIAALILLISLLLPRRRGAPASAQGLPPSRSESIQTRRS